MPESPLITAGAQIEPNSAAALHTDEFFTGMWTQGNPLGSGAVPFLYQKFYSASRYDRLIGGQNVEVTTRLTLGRRAGSSVYNAGPFPPINRFYEFRAFQGATEQIRILASVDAGTGGVGPSVREVTAGTNKTLWTKNAKAGRTSFQSVGNECFFGDGVDVKKWLLSALGWSALTQFNLGDFITDLNGNIQEAVGSQVAKIIDIQVETVSVGGTTGRKVTLFFDPSTPLKITSNITLTLAGLTTIPSLNGVTPASLVEVNSLQAYFTMAGVGLPAVTPFSAETGTASTGTGISGAAQPAWAAGLGAITVDGGLQWSNKGNALENWGIAQALVAPTATQVLAPNIYPAWVANTWYAPSAFVILDANGKIQQLTTAGVTGGGAPAWSTVTGAITADNTCNWKCLGTPSWTANAAVAVGAVVLNTFTYYITKSTSTPYPPYYTLTQVPVTVTVAFECTTAGVTGANPPAWSNGVNTTVQDNTAVWMSIGTAPAWPGAAQTLSLATVIEDSNGNLQTPQQTGISGATAPTWSPDTGSLTTEGGTQSWLNTGPYTPAGDGAWQWAWSGKNSITGHVGTASPASLPMTVGQSLQPVIQGPGLAGDPQVDTIVLWRTLQGGSTLLYEDEFPNPAVGNSANSWIYTDTTPDAGLNEFIIAPIAGANNPPPGTFVPQCYYLGRIWGYDGNALRWTGGPDTITGSGNETLPAKNKFVFPSLGVTCWPTSIGLICYTNSDVWVVLGQGTINSPFYVINFQQGVGLASQDAFAVNGSTAYGMLTSNQVVSMDPGAGEVEVGFPIGDLFASLYTGSQTYCAWHQGSSSDMALYVADGSTGWFRMATVAAPESGHVWSPQALIQGGVKAIASVETQPGVKTLLMGPAAQASPILQRDPTTNTDNGTPYASNARIGSIVMAQPGSSVSVLYVTTEEAMLSGATPVTVGLLYDEISGAVTNLVRASNDPPNLPASKTVRVRRAWAMQNAQPVICRHVQVDLSWPAENKPNELMTYTIYGKLPQKARK